MVSVSVIFKNVEVKEFTYLSFIIVNCNPLGRHVKQNQENARVKGLPAPDFYIYG